LRATLAALLCLAACGPTGAEVHEARQSTYQVDRPTLWRELTAEMHDQFPSTGLELEDEEHGVIRSAWKSVEVERSDVRGAGLTPPMEAQRVVFRALVVIQPGGPPWNIKVDGQAGQYRPDLSLVEIYKAGADDEPAWVTEKVKSLRVAIHRRLQAYSVGPILQI
jgi:hypothetical protein